MNRFIVLALLLLAASPAFANGKKKVVVLGFDGADHRIVSDMLAAGELPNLTHLQAMGGYAPLLPTNPPQTPVSWSTFATGLNPGRTGIFDFIKRQSGTYTPDFALRGRLGLESAMIDRWPTLSPGERRRWQVAAACVKRQTSSCSMSRRTISTRRRLPTWCPCSVHTVGWGSWCLTIDHCSTA